MYGTSTVVPTLVRKNGSATGIPCHHYNLVPFGVTAKSRYKTLGQS